MACALVKRPKRDDTNLTFIFFYPKNSLQCIIKAFTDRNFNHMFGFIKNRLQKIYSTFTTKLQTLFSAQSLDEGTLKELEVLLISADTGVKTTRLILENLKKKYGSNTTGEQFELKTALEHELRNLLNAKQPPTNPEVYLLVGINGSGKTTFAGKLTHQKTQEGKKVLLVAADTFRAAATEQLS